MLQSASVQDGRPRSISLTNDALGQALRRDEADGNGATGDPHELWYRFNGKQIGYVGNNDTDNIGYAASLQRRVTASVAGPFKNGQTYGAGIVEFDQAYDAINSYQQGAGGGSYTVRDGDSLSGIAAQLWGDAGLWYKLAQANGLSGDAGLAAGQTLSVPAGVVRSSNNASTFRPYDVTQAYGDSSPTTPAPQKAKANKCGVFGQVLVAVVTIAVTVALSFTPLAPVAPLIGNAAGQGLGIATGIQQKFDWGSLAMTAVTMGVTQGLDKVGAFSSLGIAGKDALATAARSVLTNAVSQGIGVATGLQSKFDWAGVAAAGIGAGVGQALGGPIASLKLGKVGGALAANTVGGIANAAARSLVNGTDFGDNLMAALPDIIGQTVGSWAAGEVAGLSASPRLAYHTTGLLADDLVMGGGVSSGSTLGPVTAAWNIAVDSTRARIVAVERQKIADRRAVEGIALPDPATLPSRIGRNVITVGQIMTQGQGYDYSSFYRDFQNAPQDVASYLTSYGGISDDYGVEYQAENMIYYSGYYDVSRLIIPTLNKASAYYDRAGVLSARLSVSVADIDRQVYEQVDRPIAFGLGGITLGAALAPVVPLLVSSTGATGGTAIALNVGGDGLAGAIANIPIRSGFGQQNTWSTFTTDSILSSTGSLIFRGAGAVGSRWVGGIGGAAGSAEAEGVVYSRIDLNGKIEPYGGQAQSYDRYLQRQIEHARNYPDVDFNFTIVDRANPGVELDVAEHLYIQQLTGEVQASKSPLVSNLRDPVGPVRRPGLGLPEPRGW